MATLDILPTNILPAIQASNSSSNMATTTTNR
jgi:hypothetical protein